MSDFFDKTARKVKKNVGRVVDRLRPPSQGSRPTSPAPSQQSVQQTSSKLEGPPLASAVSVALAAAQPSTVSISDAITPSLPAEAAATDAASPPLESPPPTVSNYASPPSHPTILASTGSAVKGLLVAARDGSDLFLPLKAALVGVVALWDIFDVNHYTSLLLAL